MDNEFRLHIYPRAQEDMEKIFEYIAVELCNPSAAIGQINDFEKALNAVCLCPEMCPYIQNQYVKDKTLRKLVVNNYIVFYRRKGEEIQVIRVLYGMRNYEALL